METRCDDATLRERLRRRATGPSVSDATVELLDKMRPGFQPVTELSPGEHLAVDTTTGLETQVAAVRAALADRPAAVGDGPREGRS